MKLKDTYITHDSDGEQILLDTSSSFAGLIRGNKTAAFIVLVREIPEQLRCSLLSILGCWDLR